MAHGPAALVAAVEQAVWEQRQVAAGHALAADLGQLALLDQLPPRTDQLKVAQTSLQSHQPKQKIFSTLKENKFLFHKQGTLIEKKDHDFSEKLLL